MISRFILAFLLLAEIADAGPRHWIAHHKRFLFMEGAAFGAAGMHAYGLHHCKQNAGVESCQEKYGSAWAYFGFLSGVNVIAMPAVAESCWKGGGGKFCNVLAYGGSSIQFGMGISQWKIGNDVTLKKEKP